METPVVSAPRWRAHIVELERLELRSVRRHVRRGRSTLLRALALLLNYLGNGWLYPLLALALLWGYPQGFVPITSSAVLGAGAAHLVYRWLKRRIARPRPCDVHPDLPPLLRPVDRYSFPSGHCMTAMAVAMPLCAALPALLLPAAAACLLIAWARLVAAHHYPSDLLAGFALGAIAATPVLLSLR
jgi:undecaprenyl-diphosphatase